MRQVSIRNFNRGFYREIKDLPVTVTVNDEPKYVVGHYSVTKTGEITPVAAKTVRKEEVKLNTTYEVCSWNKAYKCVSPAISKIRNKWYCKVHEDDTGV